jgi:hypothetical protein
LTCGVGSIPLNFFAISVGASPRRNATWDPIVKTIKAIFVQLKGRLFSIGRRVTLLNLVLSFLPIYFSTDPKMKVDLVSKL